jgi:hypothetical protein
MDKHIIDIECYKNYFCLGIKNFNTKEIKFYELSEEYNDLAQIYQYMTTFKGFLVSFNGLHYDEVVLNHLILNYNIFKNLPLNKVCIKLKQFSDKLINDDFNDNNIKKAKWYKKQYTSIDLFCYWSKMLRISKKMSLKSLAVQLGYDTIQELPYKPDTILIVKDLPKLRHYNKVHDLGITELLLTEMESEVNLRSSIVKEYGLDCWSWDAPKIASEALLDDYCKSLNLDKNQARKQRYTKPTLQLGELLKEFNPNFQLPIFQKLWKDVCNSTNSFSQDLIVNFNNTSIKLSYGIGGLHSVNNNEQYYTNDINQVVTSDVASLYPNLMLNYGCIRQPEVLNKYRHVKNERLIAKKEKNKSKDLFLKLILNSTSGLLDNEHSWLYYPEGAMKLRLIGQLILTKCIEVCLINNWQVVSANTDGIEVIVPKIELGKYQSLLDETCKLFNLDLEHEYYSKIIYSNVNNYLAVTESNSIKRKGMFKLPFNEYDRREVPLGDSCNEQVIAKALNAYYVNNIEPKDFITNPDKYNLHIYDYCKSNKISKDFIVYHNGIIQQQLNRYYFSKNAPYLFKQKNGVGTMQHVNVGEGVIIFNNYEKKEWIDYNINYKYYISSVQKIIDQLNNNNQLTLF